MINSFLLKIRILNCNSTIFQKIRLIVVCHICTRLNQKTMTSSMFGSTLVTTIQSNYIHNISSFFLFSLIIRVCVNKNEKSITTQMVRPNTIEGIEPLNLDKTPVTDRNGGRKRSTTGSQDSLEALEVVNHLKKDYNENGGCDLDDEEDEGQEEKADQSKDSDDAGLSDEGLGDITSEASNSPQPPPKDQDALTNNNEHEELEEHDSYLPPLMPSRTSPKSGVNSENSKKERLHCDNNLANIVTKEPQKQPPQPSPRSNNNYSLPTSPCDERVPSRMVFQHKSYTNL